MSFMPPAGSIFFDDREAWIIIKTDDHYRYWWNLKNKEIILLYNGPVALYKKTFFLLPSGEIKNADKNL